MTAKNDSVARFEFVLCQENGHLSKEDVPKLGALPACVHAICRAFGGDVAEPVLQDSTLSLSVHGGGQLFRQPLHLLPDMLEKTAEELRCNARLAKPKPHAVAVTSGICALLLRHFSAAHANTGLKLWLWIGNQRHALPLLKSSDFTEPVDPKASRKNGTFLVTGLFRDNTDGHQLILTKDKLYVRLDPGDPNWTWKRISKLLESPAWLEGTIIRSAKDEDWAVSPDCRITQQTTQEFTAA